MLTRMRDGREKEVKNDDDIQSRMINYLQEERAVTRAESYWAAQRNLLHFQHFTVVGARRATEPGATFQPWH